MPQLAQRPQLVVGLGNPGAAYWETRHNVGQAVVDCLAQRLRCRFRLRGRTVLGETVWGGAPLYLGKPVAFMNVIGGSVARLLRDLRLDPSRLVVVYDDLDLPFGRVRSRQKGGHGGHNGVRSVIEALGSDEFRRVKLGIGRPTVKDEIVDWVLTAFDPEERDALPPILERAADAVLELVGTGACGPQTWTE